MADLASTSLVVIDADPDGWTCSRPIVSGVWTTEEFARSTFLPVERCRRINPTSRDRCLACHSHREREAEGVDRG